MDRWGHLGWAGGGHGAGGRAQDLPTTDGLSTGGLGGAEPQGPFLEQLLGTGSQVQAHAVLSSKYSLTVRLQVMI